MSGHNRHTLNRLYEIGGADLALRYADLASSSSSSSADDRSESDDYFELRVLSLQFYNGDRTGPSFSERQFASRFSQSKAQYVYFQVELSNPWKHSSHPYTVTARYYKPDDSLMATVESQIKTNPEWRTFFHSRGRGWDEPGHWTPGHYRVEISIDGEQRISEIFTIFKDEAEEPILRLASYDWYKPPTLGLERSRSLSLFPSIPQKPSQAIESPKKDEALPPQGLGFDGWMKRINEMFPMSQKPGKEVPADDLGKMRWLSAADRRYMNAMARVRPGKTNNEVVQELKDIAADYQALLDAPPPEKIPVYTIEDLQSKLANTYSTMAQACQALGDYEGAREHYSMAIRLNRALGKENEAQRLQSDSDRTGFAQHGNVDQEISRLRHKLAKVEEGSIEEADLMIELGGIYRQNGDDFEAEKLLLQAEKILDKVSVAGTVFGDPSGADIARALTSSLSATSLGKSNNGPGDMVSVMRIKGLYRLLYVGLTRIYKESDPLQAAHYRAKAAEHDSRSTNDAFSQNMLKSLEDLFKET